MRGNWGRFTVRGSAALEAFMEAMLDEVRSVAQAVLPQDGVKALILLGGYGRGEGGVVIEKGQERPHNNLDFLIVAKKRTAAYQQSLRKMLQDALAPLVEKYGIEMDIGTTSVFKLAQSPSLVMWYDMRFGHKTVLGDAQYVPSLAHFAGHSIPAWDIRNLLVNRGTLLILNEAILRQREPDEADKKLMIKHIMKAIIGYGDARLFYAGEYTWSYVAKQRRMEQFAQVDPKFKAMYTEAVNFRFAPDYASYLDKDMHTWMSDLWDQLAPVNLFCESMRMGISNLSWSDYLEWALGHALTEDATRLRSWAKKMRNMLRIKQGLPHYKSVLPRLGYRCLDCAGLLPLLFPAIAYDLRSAPWYKTAGALLGVAEINPDALRKAYLRIWAEQGDPNCNFGKLRIRMDEEE